MTASPALDPGFELVHFVLSYYDGVREGVADHGGAPHHFEQEDEGDETDWLCRLVAYPPEIFAAASESWDIWCRAAAARGPGEVYTDLPEDVDRRRELDAIVSGWLAASEAESFVVSGDFKQLLPDARCGTVRGALQVRWTAPRIEP
jgi:hypothetical protein